MLTDPIKETTSRDHQEDVFLLVFVSADNNNVSARLTTDLFMKIGVDQLHAANPKAAYDSKINPERRTCDFHTHGTMYEVELVKYGSTHV